MANNEQRLSQRHDAAIIEDLRTVADESGLSQVTLVAACIKGLAKTWKEQKEITIPFRVVPESLYKEHIYPVKKPGNGK